MIVKRGFWQGQKDSNSQERFWRPLCYHYIMPLKANENIIPLAFCAVKQIVAYNRINFGTSPFPPRIQTTRFQAKRPQASENHGSS